MSFSALLLELGLTRLFSVVLFYHFAFLAISIALFGVNSMLTTVDLLMSDVFYKFPNLKVALSEGGIGWIPYLLERTDYSWGRHKYWTNVNADKLPSELFREHIYGCFIDDGAGIALRHKIGIDNIMFESDYPHSDCNYPHTRKLLAESLADVPDDEARKIAELNARRLYRFPG